MLETAQKINIRGLCLSDPFVKTRGVGDSEEKESLVFGTFEDHSVEIRTRGFDAENRGASQL